MNLQKDALAFRDELFKLTDSAQSILITSHKSPDDDSISAVLTTYYVLTKKYPNKNIRIVYSADFSDRWSYFKNFEKIESVPDIADIINEFDLIIALDGSQYYRFSDKPEVVQDAQAKKICIDHHSSAPNTFDLAFIKPITTSVAELLYFIFLSDNSEIPHELAEINLLGILGDTGTFKFVTPKQTSVFEAASNLVAKGNLEIQLLKSKYEGYFSKTFTIVQEIIKNAQIIEIPNWPKAIISLLPRDFVKKHNLSDIETNEAAHIYIATYGTALKDAPWGFVLYPKLNGEVKASMRSLPQSVNVRIIGEQTGLGGGHDRAGGCTFKPKNEGELRDPEQCLEELVEWMRENKPVVS